MSVPVLPTSRLRKFCQTSCVRWIQKCLKCFTSPLTCSRSPAFAQALCCSCVYVGLYIFRCDRHSPARENLAPNHHNGFTAGSKIVKYAGGPTPALRPGAPRIRSMNHDCAQEARNGTWFRILILHFLPSFLPLLTEATRFDFLFRPYLCCCCPPHLRSAVSLNSLWDASALESRGKLLAAVSQKHF